MTDTTAKPAPSWARNADAPSIYAQVVGIMGDLGALEKDGTGPATQGGYRYISAGAVVAALQPLFVKHGVVLAPARVDEKGEVRYAQEYPVEKEPSGWSGKVANSRTRAVVVIDYVLYSAVDGSSMPISMAAESADTGDRAIRKAATVALKTALMQTFMIVDSEYAQDESSDSEEAVENQAVQAQKVDRASQNISGARATATGQKAPAPKREAATPPAEEKESPIKLAKASLRDAIVQGGGQGVYTTQIVDAIGKRLHDTDRAGWITDSRKIKKIADEILMGVKE